MAPDTHTHKQRERERDNKTVFCLTLWASDTFFHWDQTELKKKTDRTWQCHTCGVSDPACTVYYHIAWMRSHAVNFTFTHTLKGDSGATQRDVWRQNATDTAPHLRLCTLVEGGGGVSVENCTCVECCGWRIGTISWGTHIFPRVVCRDDSGQSVSAVTDEETEILRSGTYISPGWLCHRLWPGCNAYCTQVEPGPGWGRRGQVLGTLSVTDISFLYTKVLPGLF